MPLALSTSWNAYRHDNAKDLLFEIKQLGFNDIELSFNLTRLLVDEISKVARDIGLNILSLHNYCPIPEGLSRKEALPDCFSLSALDSEERKRAVSYTKRTIDYASSLGAKAVVLHCGRVEIEDKTRELIAFYDSKCLSSEKAIRVRDEFLKKREDLSGSFLEKVLISLDELNAYAGSKGVLLGVENRFYYREIPNFEEIGVILTKFKGSSLAYWHDTGHARVMESLGFIKNGSFLKAYAPDLIGAHLHNTLGCLDHQAPSKGDLDFKEMNPFFRKDTIKVIEAHQPATAEELKESLRLLQGIFNGIL
jgi:sugar phosphate isomerase/epimerase